MNWGSVSEFLAMGGKGLYVWGSYGVTFAVIALEIALLVLRRRAAGKAQ
jgi:heme exporter protein D